MEFPEAVANKVLPKPGHVWWVRDSEIQLSQEKREDKFRRVCLVVSTEDNLKFESPPIINIVPITRAGNPSTYRMPIGRENYGYCVEGFEPDPRQLAVLNFCQPIRFKHFIEPCGELRLEFYYSIVDALAFGVLGHECYNYEP